MKMKKMLATILTTVIVAGCASTALAARTYTFSGRTSGGEFPGQPVNLTIITDAPKSNYAFFEAEGWHIDQITPNDVTLTVEGKIYYGEAGATTSNYTYQVFDNVYRKVGNSPYATVSGCFGISNSNSTIAGKASIYAWFYSRTCGTWVGGGEGNF